MCLANIKFILILGLTLPTNKMLGDDVVAVCVCVSPALML